MRAYKKRSCHTGIMFTLLFVMVGLNMPTSHASEKALDGYMGARFGMSAKEILRTIKDDGLVKISDEVHDGDREIQASRDRGWIKTNVVYVLSKGRDKLSLVIEIYPGVVSPVPLERELKEAYGTPLAKDISAQILEQLKQQMPNLIDLTLWARKIESKDRVLRLLSFSDHIAVEYFEPNLLK